MNNPKNTNGSIDPKVLARIDPPPKGGEGFNQSAEDASPVSASGDPDPREGASIIPSRKRQFSLFFNCRCRKPERQLTLSQFVSRVRDGWWDIQVNQCRRTLKAQGEKAYKEDRASGVPVVMLSARVKIRQKKLTLEDQGAAHSGLLQLDFDGKDHPDMSLAEIRQTVEAAPFVRSCFVSLSGEGIKGIGLCPASFETHAGSWYAAEAYFAEHGLKLDPSTKDPLRLCFVSFDPEASFFEDREEIVPIEVPAKSAKSAKHESSEGTEDPEHVHRTLERLAKKIGPYQKRDTWIHIVGATVDAVGAEAAGEIVDEHFPPLDEEDDSACDVAHGLPGGTWLSLRKYGVDPEDYVKLMPNHDREPEDYVKLMPNHDLEESGAEAKPARKRLKDYRVNHIDTLSMTLKEIDALRPLYIIDGILRWGEVVLLGAESKSRKSWLVQDGAFAVASGRPWLADADGHNGFATAQARVHIFDLELNKGEVRYRFAKARAGRFKDRLDDATEMTSAVSSYSLDGLDKGKIRALLKELKATVQPGDLVIVDCLYRLCPDGNEVKDLADILEEIKRFASETQAGVIVVDHFRKAAADKSRDRFAGSFIKQASASTLIGIEVTAKDVLVLDIYARTFYGCPKVHVRFNPDTYAFERLPEHEVEQAKAESTKAEAEGWLLTLWDGLPVDSPILTADAKERWNLTRQAAVNRLQKLVTRKWLVVDAKRGKPTEWSLTPKGNEIVVEREEFEI